MRRFVRILKGIGKGMLVVLGLLIVTLVIARFVFVHQLNSEIAEIKARGEPLTEAAMAGPPVPDSENAALVYEKAYTALPKGDALYRRMDAIGQALRRGDAKSLAEARHMMKPYATAISLAQMAASMPRCRFETNTADMFTDAPGSKLRQLATLLANDAILHARAGGMDGATTSIIAILRMNSRRCDGPSLLAALRSESLAIRACNVIREVAKCSRISVADARRVSYALAELHIYSFRKQSLQNERVLVCRLMGTPQNDPARWLRTQSPPPASLWANLDPLDLTYQHVLSVGDEAAHLRYLDKLIRAKYATYADAQALKHEGEWGIPFYAILTRILTPVEARSLESMFKAQAQVNGSQVFLALLAYRDRHKAYPASLAGLRKDPGWAVPVDPFTGRDFVYRVNGRGFLLYSLGPDMQDNGGRPQPKGKAYREGAEYDIPWEMSR